MQAAALAPRLWRAAPNPARCPVSSPTPAADKHSIPKVNNTNVDRSVATIHATVLGCLRRTAQVGTAFGSGWVDIGGGGEGVAGEGGRGGGGGGGEAGAKVLCVCSHRHSAHCGAPCSSNK